MENAFQHIVQHELTVTPVCNLLESMDGYGNYVQYGSLAEQHDCIRIASQGVVECGDYVLPDDTPADYYLFPSALTQWDNHIKGMSKEQTPQGIMNAVYSNMRYVRFVTDNQTTAINAYAKGEGVCQDYAHVMIAACRAAGLHARYVCGLVEGEGETHAWVEVWRNGFWLGYDPTYNRENLYNYVKIAHGRDAADCPVNRGRFYQWTTEHMTVNCKVETIQ